MRGNISQPTAQGRTGQYAGDNNANHVIAHGLGHVPGCIFINIDTVGNVCFMINGAVIVKTQPSTAAVLAVTAPDAQYFYVGNAGSMANSANALGTNYNWTAI